MPVEKEAIVALPVVNISSLYELTLQTYVNYYNVINDKFSSKMKDDIRKIEKFTKAIFNRVDTSDSNEKSLFRTFATARHSIEPLYKDEIKPVFYDEYENRKYFTRTCNRFDCSRKSTPLRCVRNICTQRTVIVNDPIFPKFHIKKRYMIKAQIPQNQ